MVHVITFQCSARFVLAQAVCRPHPLTVRAKLCANIGFDNWHAAKLAVMKVCFAHYDSPSDVGGVSTWLQRLLPLLRDAGIEIEVHIMAFGGKPSANCAVFNRNNIKIRWIPFQWHLPRAVRSLSTLINESKPDIYIPNCIIPAYYAGGYARRSGISTIGVLHSDDPFYWGIFDEFVAGRRDFRVSAIVPVSTFLESQISPTAAASEVMVRRIGCGVRIPLSTAKAPISVFRLLYLGRLVEEQKRISEVTRALCALAERVPEVEAWIVGEGGARGSVEGIIREKGMDARVHLLGRVDSAEIYDVLTQCHAMVLLSDYEGLPVSMLEAMAAGVVPICLDMRSGIREAIEHGVNGLIVKDRAADFFAAVKSLIDDLAKWRQLSDEARGTAQRCYSIEDCARKWIDLLEEVNQQPLAARYSRSFQIARLPKSNPKFGQFGMRLPWRQRIEEAIRCRRTIYRAAKAAWAIGRSIRDRTPFGVRRDV